MKKTIVIAVLVSLLAVTMYFIIPTRVLVVSSDYEISYYNKEQKVFLNTASLIEYLEVKRFNRKFGRGVGIDKTKSVVITLLPEDSNSKPLEIVYNEGEISLSYLMVGNHYYKLTEADMTFIKELL